MTKKRALKLIMAFGHQRNEAETLLQLEHTKGKTNQEAFESIIEQCDEVQTWLQNMRKAIQPAINAMIEMAKAFNKITLSGGNINEDPGD